MGQELTWGGRQHRGPVAFYTVPLPEVQREDLAVEHRPLRESLCERGREAIGHGRPSPRGGTARET